jgi:hypothetical protein
MIATISIKALSAELNAWGGFQIEGGVVERKRPLKFH